MSIRSYTTNPTDPVGAALSGAVPSAGSPAHTNTRPEGRRASYPVKSSSSNAGSTYGGSSSTHGSSHSSRSDNESDIVLSLINGAMESGIADKFVVVPYSSEAFSDIPGHQAAYMGEAAFFTGPGKYDGAEAYTVIHVFEKEEAAVWRHLRPMHTTDLAGEGSRLHKFLNGERVVDDIFKTTSHAAIVYIGKLPSQTFLPSTHSRGNLGSDIEVGWLAANDMTYHLTILHSGRMVGDVPVNIHYDEHKYLHAFSAGVDSFDTDDNRDLLMPLEDGGYTIDLQECYSRMSGFSELLDFDGTDSLPWGAFGRAPMARRIVKAVHQTMMKLLNNASSSKRMITRQVDGKIIFDQKYAYIETVSRVSALALQIYSFTTSSVSKVMGVREIYRMDSLKGKYTDEQKKVIEMQQACFTESTCHLIVDELTKQNSTLLRIFCAVLLQAGRFEITGYDLEAVIRESSSIHNIVTSLEREEYYLDEADAYLATSRFHPALVSDSFFTEGLGGFASKYFNPRLTSLTASMAFDVEPAVVAKEVDGVSGVAAEDELAARFTGKVRELLSQAGFESAATVKTPVKTPVRAPKSKVTEGSRTPGSVSVSSRIAGIEAEKSRPEKRVDFKDSWSNSHSPTRSPSARDRSPRKTTISRDVDEEQRRANADAASDSMLADAIPYEAGEDHEAEAETDERPEIEMHDVSGGADLEDPVAAEEVTYDLKKLTEEGELKYKKLKDEIRSLKHEMGAGLNDEATMSRLTSEYDRLLFDFERTFKAKYEDIEPTGSDYGGGGGAAPKAKSKRGKRTTMRHTPTDSGGKTVKSAMKAKAAGAHATSSGTGDQQEVIKALERLTIEQSKQLAMMKFIVSTQTRMLETQNKNVARLVLIETEVKNMSKKLQPGGAVSVAKKPAPIKVSCRVMLRIAVTWKFDPKAKKMFLTDKMVMKEQMCGGPCKGECGAIKKFGVDIRK